MTAITISRPMTPLAAGRPARATTQPRRPSRVAPASGPAERSGRARSDAAPASRLRLTRRGRLVILTLLLLAGIAASLFVGGVGTAGTHVERVPVRYITVAPGETLWAIAGEVAPQADRRDTVARILELNAMADAGLRAGQRIAVPLR